MSNLILRNHSGHVVSCSESVIIPDSFCPSGPKSDELALLAFVLITLTASVQKRQLGFYLPFSTKFWWHPLFGRGYQNVKEEAEKQNLIELNEIYSVGVFSKSVRLTKVHRSGSWKLYKIRKPSILRRLQKWRKGVQKRLGETGVFLSKCFNNFRLELTRREISRQSIYSGFLIVAIQEGYYFANRCEYGRFHSTFTGLPRKVRKKLTTIQGQKTVEIDIANCQPLLLGLLVAEQMSKSDVSSYMDLCVNGQIYDCFSNCLPRLEYIDKKGQKRARRANKQTAKQKFLEMTFGSQSQMAHNPLFESLEKRFPSVACFLVSSKMERYQAVAHKLQRFESSIMIDVCVRSYMRESLDVLTIHDSVIVADNKEETVRDIIYEAFSSWGVRPLLNIS